MNISIRILLLVIGIVIVGSIEHITVPIMLQYYKSIYFITFVTSIQGIFNYGLILILVIKYQKKEFIPMKNKNIIIKSGIANGLMSLCFVYSANPARTPVVIQSILLGTIIVPSVILTKYILKKSVFYDPKYIGMSILLLFISIITAAIPIFKEGSATIGIIGYFLAVMLMSFDNIFQELYIRNTQDNTFVNKLTFAFYSSIVNTVTVLIFFWMEIAFGYTHSPWQTFVDSFKVFGTNATNFVLLQLFIWVCLLLYLQSLYLNSLSTNYNMILTNLTNQSVALFFTLFPQFNNGTKHPISIVIVTIFLNIIAVMLWIKGEIHYSHIETTQTESIGSIESIELEKLTIDKIDSMQQ
jgi:hypothetical protein